MKKNVPLKVLEILEPFVGLNGRMFDSVEPGNFLLKYVDKDEESDFYFNVESYKNNSGFKLVIDRKPFTKESVNSGKAEIPAGELSGYLQTWTDILTGYERVKSTFDDPIIKSYADEYWSEFEIINDDEDADINPFPLKTVLLLDTHLEEMQTALDKYSSINPGEVESIKESISDLRDNLTAKSKKWVVEKVTKIWAKVTKLGPKAMKEIFAETKKQVITQGIKYAIEHAPSFISGLSEAGSQT